MLDGEAEDDESAKTELGDEEGPIRHHLAAEKLASKGSVISLPIQQSHSFPPLSSMASGEPAQKIKADDVAALFRKEIQDAVARLKAVRSEC